MHFSIISCLHVLKRLNKFLQNIDETLSLLFLHGIWWKLFWCFRSLIISHLDLLSKRVNLVIQNLDCLSHLLYLLILIVFLQVIVIELLNRLCQLRIHVDQLLQRLLKNIVFILQFRHFLTKLDDLIFWCKVILKFFRHLINNIMQF